MTTRHPGEAALRAYREGALAPDELLAVDDHLALCAACRATGGAAAAVRRFAEGLGGAHLAYEAMERHVDGRSSPEEQAATAAHIDFCEACRAELDDLARFRTVQRRGTGRWGSLAAAAAAAAALAAGIAGIVALRDPHPVRTPVPPVSPRVAVTPVRPPAVADPFQLLDPSLRQAASALESGTLVSAGLLESLRDPPGQQRAGDGPEDRLPRLLEPVGAVVESDRPVFRWSGTATVRVQVFDREYRLVAESPALREASWRVPSRLRRGALYRWQLAVRNDGGEESIAPAPPAAAARFRVLDERASAALAAARDSGSTLEAGLICIREGLVAEGARELARYAEEHPESARAARLAEQARAASAAAVSPPHS